MARGKIFNIEEFGVHDGTGIRKIVFFKGCPLHCNWCHNPEGIAFETEFLVSRDGRKSLCGTEYEPGDLARELLRGKEILVNSGGGITISGGEPLAQPEFLLELMEHLKSIHIVIETSGYAREDIFQNVAAKADCLFMDVKHVDPAMHKRHTGVDNTPILKNLEFLCQSDTRFVVRIPLIPGVNDTRKNMKDTAGLLTGAKNLVRVELMPYHKTAGAKYAMVGRVFEPLFDVDREIQIHMEEFERYHIETVVM
ncbi:MAG: radical SAM protein [Bacteroidota bacterium]